MNKFFFATAIFALCTLISSVDKKPYEQKKLKKKEALSINSLPEKDKNLLKQCIENLANNPLEDLSKINQEERERLAQFKKVPYLELSSFLLSDPKCYQDIKTIIQTEQKLLPFLFVLSIKIREAKEDGSLDELIEEFSNLTHLDKSVITNLINKKDYKGLINYIFS